MILTDKCKEDFDKWLYGEKVATLANKDFISKKVYTTTHFYNLPLSMQWGVYQTYFWETKRWWISIYPYTDKFGGKIVGFWDEGYFNSNFITNVPEQAQTKIVDKANEIYNETF